MTQRTLQIAEEQYKPDELLLDRYQSFSSELLRIALLGIAGVGFFLEKFMEARAANQVRVWCFISVSAFGLCSIAALAHRYCSTDGMFYHLRFLRGLPVKKGRRPDDEQRNALFKISTRLLLLATCALGAGTVALVVAFGVLLGRLAAAS